MSVDYELRYYYVQYNSIGIKYTFRFMRKLDQYKIHVEDKFMFATFHNSKSRAELVFKMFLEALRKFMYD